MRLPKYIKSVDNELWFTEDDRDNLKISYRVKEIVFSQMSDIQHVMILDSYDFGKMLVLDGVVQTTSIDGYIYNEMIAHIPLTLHQTPKRVLIIGGGDCGVAKEAVKYPEIRQIDMVEIDELVVDVCKKHLKEVSGNISDPRVSFIYADGVKYASKSNMSYDVIIVDSSDPVGPAVQLFELSFYTDLRSLLAGGGIMVCQSQSPVFHLSIMKQTYNRMSSLFDRTKIYTATVPTYPGGLWSFTIGMDKSIDLKDIKFDKDTKYVTKDLIGRCFKLPRFMEDSTG